MDNIKIAKILLKIAKSLEADYEYRSDPDHKHKPKGGGWKQTEQGWSKSDNSKQKTDSNTSNADSTSTEPVKPEKYGNVNAPIRKAIKAFRKNFRGLPTGTRSKFKKNLQILSDDMQPIIQKVEEFKVIQKDPMWKLLTKKEQRTYESKVEALVTIGQYHAYKKFYTSNLNALHIAEDRQGKINHSIYVTNDEVGECIQQGVNALNGIIDKDIVPTDKVTIVTHNESKDKDGRSGYGSGMINGEKINGILLVGIQQFDISTVTHEMGHFIEENSPGVGKLCQEFLKARTEGEEPQSLNKIAGKKAYADDEISCRDHFPRPYCGKIYDDGSTEILSTGIQMLTEDPMEFYNKDPEFFYFVLGILRGEFKNYNQGA